MRYTLRSWALDDAPYLAQILNNLNIQDNLRDGLPYPYLLDDARDYIRFILSTKEDMCSTRAICIHDKPIGNISIIRGDNIHRCTAELGYYLAEPFWGKGIVTHAVKEACHFVFENTDILRIYAEPFSDNIPSCRVLEKAGFSLEGIMRKNALKNGEVRDMKLFAKIK